MRQLPILGGFIIVACLFAWYGDNAQSAVPASTPGTANQALTLELSGEGVSTARITYGVPPRVTTVTTPLPWTASQRSGDPGSLVFTATLQSGSGSLTCRVLAGGTETKRNSGTGYANCG